MNYKEKATQELLTALSSGKQDSVKMFSVGRNIMKSVPCNESVKSIITIELIMAFNQYKVQYIGSLSTDDELVFFNIKEDRITLKGEEKIVGYIYDETTNCIVVKIID